MSTTSVVAEMSCDARATTNSTGIASKQLTSPAQKEVTDTHGPNPVHAGRSVYCRERRGIGHLYVIYGWPQTDSMQTYGVKSQSFTFSNERKKGPTKQQTGQHSPFATKMQMFMIRAKPGCSAPSPSPTPIYVSGLFFK